MRATLSAGRRLAEIAARELRHGNRDFFRIVWRDARRRRGDGDHLDARADAAMDWLCRAQDATASGGVARSYCLAWIPAFRASGWLPPYPETTGYIIPTMFDYAVARGRSDVRARAIAMADWEIDVQMPNGAVQGGIIGMPPTPAVFNTGQVIFGWLRAARETGDDRYLRAAERAGRFLVEHQDDDGVWRRGLSQHAKAGPQTYNARTAWALLELADTTGDDSFRRAGRRNIDSALRRQLPNGWFSGNCLDDDDAPLTHTIAYATRGVLEAGHNLGDERYLLAARRTGDALLSCQQADGRLAGRYGRAWQATVRWSCLTGNLQVANVWLHLSDLLGDLRYAHSAGRAIRFVASTQALADPNQGISGGIAGAYPIYGDYGRFEYLNWAAKFFVEAILTEQALARRRASEIARTDGVSTGAPPP